MFFQSIVSPTRLDSTSYENKYTAHVLWQWFSKQTNTYTHRELQLMGILCMKTTEMTTTTTTTTTFDSNSDCDCDGGVGVAVVVVDAECI